MKVTIVEIITCGDYYCTGHGDGQKIQGELLSNGKILVSGKIYNQVGDIFNTGIRDIVEIRDFKTGKKL